METSLSAEGEAKLRRLCCCHPWSSIIAVASTCQHKSEVTQSAQEQNQKHMKQTVTRSSSPDMVLLVARGKGQSVIVETQELSQRGLMSSWSVLLTERPLGTSLDTGRSQVSSLSCVLLERRYFKSGFKRHKFLLLSFLVCLRVHVCVRYQKDSWNCIFISTCEITILPNRHKGSCDALILICYVTFVRLPVEL